MSQELERVSHDVARAEDFLPLLTVEQAVGRKKQINQYISGVMTEGEDFGKMPGDSRKDAKRVLLKPGAEKLCSVFGLVPQYVKETVIEDWTGKDHGGEALFYYEYRCILYRGGRAMGEAIGSCNSWETKYRYRWVSEEMALGLGLNPDDLPKKGGVKMIFEPQFALDKRATDGQYAKPAEYWDAFEDAIKNKTAKNVTKQLGKREYTGWEMQINSTSYRIPNQEVADTVNTLQKMAQKRALVAAVLVVTNCSDAFTQDVEDFDHGTADDHRTVDAEVVKETKEAPQENGRQVAIPQELADKMKAWSVAQLNPLIEGLKEVKQRLLEVLPQNGADEYQRIMEAHGVKPKGNDNAILRAALVNAWVLADRLKAKQPSLPLIREYAAWSDAPDALDVLGKIRVAGVLYEPNEERTAFNKVVENA